MSTKAAQDSSESSAFTTLNQMLKGFVVTQMIYVAAKLGIADLLEDGPRSSDELAKAAGAHAHTLYRMLRTLASQGIFAETALGRFQLTPLADLLRSDAPGSLRAYAIIQGEKWTWQPFGELLNCVKTGEAPFSQLYGVTWFEYFKQHPDAAKIYNAAMVDRTEHELSLAAAYDYSDVRTVVDVGGGHGALLAALLRSHAHLRGVLFEQPSVVDGARRYLEKEGLADRCELVAGDFFESAPSGGDLYILKHIIHDWQDDRAATILKNCRCAMSNDSKLLLLESVIPPGNEPSFTKIRDMTMLVLAGGTERSEVEYRSLLEAAGLKLLSIIAPQPSTLNIIEAAPV